MNFEERILRLEKENRRWRWAAAGLLLMLIVIVAAGAGEKSKEEPIHEKLRAKEIELVNDDGKTVGNIIATHVGGSMNLWSVDDKSKINLFAHDQGVTSMYIENQNDGFDIRGNSMMFLELKPGEKQSRRTRLALGMNTTTKGGYIEVYNPLDNRVISIQSSLKNEGVIGVYHVDGTLANFLTPDR